jgi:hypothetical protein
VNGQQFSKVKGVRGFRRCDLLKINEKAKIRANKKKMFLRIKTYDDNASDN